MGWLHSSGGRRVVLVQALSRERDLAPNLTRLFAGATMGKADLTFSEIGLLWRARFPSTTD
jgi:hypothetical protein